MAFGRKVFGPRRVIIAVQTTDGETFADPAVDVANSDVAGYVESLYELDKLKLVTGLSPTYWTIQPLTRRQKDAMDHMGRREMAHWIIRFGLVAVDNFTVGGEPVTVPERKPHGSYGLALPESFLDQLDLSSSVLHSLSGMILRLSEAQAPT